jgi:hypothetical protein
MFFMNEKVESLYKNQTYELVKEPQDQKIVGCKWVYSRKD